MTLIVTDLDGHNPPIELSTGKIHIRDHDGFIEIYEVDGGVTKMVLTVPRGVEVEVVP